MDKPYKINEETNVISSDWDRHNIFGYSKHCLRGQLNFYRDRFVTIETEEIRPSASSEIHVSEENDKTKENKHYNEKHPTQKHRVRRPSNTFVPKIRTKIAKYARKKYNQSKREKQGMEITSHNKSGVHRAESKKKYRQTYANKKRTEGFEPKINSPDKNNSASTLNPLNHSRNNKHQLSINDLPSCSKTTDTPPKSTESCNASTTNANSTDLHVPKEQEPVPNDKDKEKPNGFDPNMKGASFLICNLLSSKPKSNEYQDHSASNGLKIEDPEPICVNENPEITKSSETTPCSSTSSFRTTSVHPCKRNKGWFTNGQLLQLEKHFQYNRYPCRDFKIFLSRVFDVPEKKINEWFANRRAKLYRYERSTQL